MEKGWHKSFLATENVSWLSQCSGPKAKLQFPISNCIHLHFLPWCIASSRGCSPWRRVGTPEFWCPQTHLVLGGCIHSIWNFDKQNKMLFPSHFPKKKSSVAVVLNNSLPKKKKNPSIFFLTLLQLNRKIPHHKQCMRTRSPRMINEPPFLSCSLNLKGFSSDTPSFYFQIS